MAMIGGTGRVGYFYTNAELGKEYTRKDIRDFFERTSSDHDFGVITPLQSKNIFNNLFRSASYDVELLKNPNRVIIKNGNVIPTTPNKWTVDVVKQSALKFKTKKEWYTHGKHTYYAARRLNIIKECSAHMIPVVINRKRKWTIETVKQSALECSSKSEWRLKAAGAFNAAKELNILDECTAHMPARKRKWTIEIVKQSALEFSSKSEWRLKAAGAYDAAKRLKIFEECVAHMTKK